MLRRSERLNGQSQVSQDSVPIEPGRADEQVQKATRRRKHGRFTRAKKTPRSSNSIPSEESHLIETNSIATVADSQAGVILPRDTSASDEDQVIDADAQPAGEAVAQIAEAPASQVAIAHQTHANVIAEEGEELPQATAAPAVHEPQVGVPGVEGTAAHDHGQVEALPITEHSLLIRRRRLMIDIDDELTEADRLLSELTKAQERSRNTTSDKARHAAFLAYSDVHAEHSQVRRNVRRLEAKLKELLEQAQSQGLDIAAIPLQHVVLDYEMAPPKKERLSRLLKRRVHLDKMLENVQTAKSVYSAKKSESNLNVFYAMKDNVLHARTLYNLAKEGVRRWEELYGSDENIDDSESGGNDPPEEGDRVRFGTSGSTSKHDNPRRVKTKKKGGDDFMVSEVSEVMPPEIDVAQKSSLSHLPIEMQKVVVSGTTVKPHRTLHNQEPATPAMPQLNVSRGTVGDGTIARLHHDSSMDVSERPQSEDEAARRSLRPRSRRADSNDLVDGADLEGSADSSEEAEFSEPDGGDGTESDAALPSNNRREARNTFKGTSRAKKAKRPRDGATVGDDEGSTKKHKTGPIPTAAFEEAKKHVQDIEQIALRVNKSPEAFYEKLGLMGGQSRSNTNDYNNFEMWFSVHDQDQDEKKRDGSDYAKLISEEYHKKCAEPDSRKFFDEVNKWAAEMCRVEIDTTPQLRGICGKGELEFRRFAIREELLYKNVWVGLRVNVSDNPQANYVRGFISGTGLGTKALAQMTNVFNNQTAHSFESIVKYNDLIENGLQDTESNRPWIDVTYVHKSQQDYYRSILAKYTKSALKCFFNGRDTPNDKPFEISKPIIPQLYEKQMAIIRFPHGIDGKLACVGDEKRQKQKKKFSWDSFVLDGKAFPSSRSYKGPLQVIVEPIIEEQHAMRQKKTTPEGLEVFYFKDLRSELEGKEQEDTLNIPLITTSKGQVLVTIADCLRLFPNLRDSSAVVTQTSRDVTGFQHSAESYPEFIQGSSRGGNESYMASSDNDVDLDEIVDQLLEFPSSSPYHFIED